MAEVDLFNPHDGLTGRDGGPYLDEVERRNAETIRAAKEDREPDYDNAPAVAGTPLVTGATLANIANPASNPSQNVTGLPVLNPSDVAAKDDNLLQVFSTRPQSDDEAAIEEGVSPKDNPASPVYVSKDEGQDNVNEYEGKHSDDASVSDETEVKTEADSMDDPQINPEGENGLVSPFDNTNKD